MNTTNETLDDILDALPAHIRGRITSSALERLRDLPEAHRGAIAERAAVIARGMTVTAGCVRQGAPVVRLTLPAKEVEK